MNGTRGKTVVLAVMAQAVSGLTMPAMANVVATPVEIWLPGPGTAADLLVGPDTGDGQVYLAQSCNDCEGEETGNDEVETTSAEARGTGAFTLTEGNTGRIVSVLREANVTCTAGVPEEYRLDCLRNYYLALANSLPNTGDYVPVKKALREGAAKLDAIIKANVDTSAPKIRPHQGNLPDAPRTKPLRAVKKEAAKEAARQAESVIAETSLVILRAGEDPTRRTAHYAQVSQAVESNLVILRSA
ncbi:MAG: hypothetical protein R3D63_05435 [Paracoccaceae bacterium]